MSSKSLLAICVSAIGLTSNSQAAVTLLGHYGLGESGSVTGASPFTPLLDSAGTPNNITNSQSVGASSSIGTAGVAAPGSTSYLQKTSGNSGWFGGANYNITNDWAVQIWMRPDTNVGTVQFQTDNSTSGVSIWFQSGGAAGLDIAFGNGSGGTANGTTNDTDYALNTWYRIGIVNYNGINHYFVDGNEVATSSIGGLLNSPMIGFAQGGLNGGTGAYDELNVWSFDHNTDSLGSIVNVMNGVPEPSVTLLGGLGVLAMLRRRRC